MNCSEAEILSLIELAKTELSMNDVSTIDCRDFEKINAAFHRIGQKLNKQGSEVKIIWSIFVKTYAWLVQNEDHETGEISWPYSEAMSFLKPYVKNYNLIDLVNGERLIDYEGTLEAGIPVPVFSDRSYYYGEDIPYIINDVTKPREYLLEDPVVGEPNDCSQISKVPSPSPSNVVLKKSLEVEDALCQYLKKKITKQKDPNELFLISVAHDMKLLSPEDQAVFKMKVQQLLVEMINKKITST